MMIARLLEEGDVGGVVVCNAAETRAISHARVKSDRFDAAMLAKLLSAGMLKAVWVPDEATFALRRRVARRAGLVRARTRVKNEVHAVLARCLLGRPPVSDLFGKKGRVWLTEQQLPGEEAETVASCLRHRLPRRRDHGTGPGDRAAGLGVPRLPAAVDDPWC
jgi:transposase